MSAHVDDPRKVDSRGSGSTELWLAGALMVGGWLTTVVATLFHPAGAEDDHEVIFTQYAESGAWIAVHLVQTIGVLTALSGMIVLYRLLRATAASLVAHLAAAATVVTAAVWAVLQGLDGVGLKQAVDAWAASNGVAERVLFANAETIRWLEWGFQSYFRLMLGLSFVLFGAAILVGRLVAAWMGWTAILAGAVSLAIGIDVGYSGLASNVQDILGITFLVVGLAFAVGLLSTGMRGRGQLTAGHRMARA
jgi:hypothetical protein